MYDPKQNIEKSFVFSDENLRDTIVNQMTIYNDTSNKIVAVLHTF